MKRISKDYTNELKEDLQSEADARKLTVQGTGANGQVTKDDLVLALEINDEDQAQKPPLNPTASAPAAPALVPSPPTFVPAPKVDLPANIPRVEDQEDAPEQPFRKMPALIEYKGRYKNRDDGQVYALAIFLPDERHLTHKAMNSKSFWEGTEDQFRKVFDKE